jgi:hypothetical protein
MIIITQHCPHCKHHYSEKYCGLSTELGPAIAKCSRCQTVFRSDKVEWWAMSAAKKAVFWALTACYIAFLGPSLGGLMFAVIQGIIYGKPDRWPSLEGITLGIFTICFVLFPATILGIQLYRIVQSRKRTRRSSDSEIAVSTAFLNLEFGLQTKLLYVWCSLFGMAGLLITYR